MTPAESTAIESPTRLADLARVANEANTQTDLIIGQMRDLFSRAAEAAIIAGHALLEAKGLVEAGGWSDWCEANLEFSRNAANTYMRIAHYETDVREWLTRGGNGTVLGARQYLKGMPGLHKRHPKYPEAQSRAMELHAEGLNAKQIAEEVGVAWVTVREWVEPAYGEDRSRRRREARTARAITEGRREVPTDEMTCRDAVAWAVATLAQGGFIAANPQVIAKASHAAGVGVAEVHEMWKRLETMRWKP